MSSRPANQYCPEAAFTLVELLTVIALLSVLAAVATGSIQGVKQRAATSQARTELAHLVQGLEEFKRRYGDYPSPGGSSDTGKLLFAALTGVSTGGPAMVDLHRLSAESMVFVDPWGRPYRYIYQEAAGHPDGPADFQLFSVGPDGMTARPASGDRANWSNADDIVAGEWP